MPYEQPLKLNLKLLRLFNDVPLPDSGAFLDPLVVGFDHSLEIGVSKELGWYVRAKSSNFCPLKSFQLCLRWWEWPTRN